MAQDWVSQAQKYAGKLGVGSGPVPLKKDVINGKEVKYGEASPRGVSKREKK